MRDGPYLYLVLSFSNQLLHIYFPPELCVDTTGEPLLLLIYMLSRCCFSTIFKKLISG
uniref:Uncharacterized protein n=1 Tax=Anguilla anguilla TaxID=7936 RepID=A0A0E9SK46_ANGAN